MIRQLLTIIRFEFLMQVKTIRFKGMCGLAIFFCFGLYDGALSSMELRPSRTFLGFDILPFYLLAAIFAGLFSIGRVRKTGMHAILFACPFPTFLLVLGQTIAALLSLLPPLAIVCFPTGLFLKWRYAIEFPLPPLFYVILFFFIPAFCVVLAATIWVRTCFKNNLMALIILGLLFAGCAYVGNGDFINTESPTGKIHNFIPMVSLFSRYYWQQMETAEILPTISFTQTEDWIRFAMTLLLAWVFLHLSSYHLRRTEPHRKVLGSYGRRWYHAPTFVKMAFDLKVDPHVRWKSHLVLAVLVGTILVRSAWPIARPYLTPYLGQLGLGGAIAQARAPMPGDTDRLDPKSLPEESILPLHILFHDQAITLDSLTSKITFTCDLADLKDIPSSGTVAVMSEWGRWDFFIDQIAIGKTPIPFLKVGRDTYLDGETLRPFCDGSERVLTITGSRDSTTMQQFSGLVNVFLFTRGFFFLEKKAAPDMSGNVQFDRNATYFWPTRLSLVADATLSLIDSPVPPDEVIDILDEEVKKTDILGREKKKLKNYLFNIPGERNIQMGRIQFISPKETLIEFQESGIQARFMVPKYNEQLFREILDLARPALKDFAILHGISMEESAFFNVDNWQWQMRDLRRSRAQYERTSHRSNRFQDNIFRGLDRLETDILLSIYVNDFRGRGPLNFYRTLDLSNFFRQNLVKGMNQRFSLRRDFASPQFEPVMKRLDINQSHKIEQMSRKQLISGYGTLPLFQMLYLTLGHDVWKDMMRRFKPRVQAKVFTIEMLEECAMEALAASQAPEGEPDRRYSPEELRDFFNYWTRTGEGLPAYHIESVTARMIANVENDQDPRYSVEATITNLGSGRILVPVALNTAKSPMRDRLWIGPHETVEWKVASRHLPKDVTVDPQGWILSIARVQGEDGVQDAKATVPISKILKADE